MQIVHILVFYIWIIFLFHQKLRFRSYTKLTTLDSNCYWNIQLWKLNWRLSLLNKSFMWIRRLHKLVFHKTPPHTPSFLRRMENRSATGASHKLLSSNTLWFCHFLTNYQILFHITVLGLPHRVLPCFSSIPFSFYRHFFQNKNHIRIALSCLSPQLRWPCVFDCCDVMRHDKIRHEKMNPW